MSHHYELKRVDSLRPHPENVSLFGPLAGDLDPAFLESVRANGVLTPLTVTADGLILSGHRRHEAARQAGLEHVPCVVVRPADAADADRRWLEANRQRRMSQGQMAAWLKRLEQNEKQRRANLPVAEPGRVLDSVAASAGLSRRTVQTALMVDQTIETLEASGETAKAQQVREARERSIHAGCQTAKAVTRSTTPPVDDDDSDCRQWTKSDVSRFKSSFSTIIRMIDDGVQRELCTAAEHGALLTQFKQFGRNWQSQFATEEWL